jgi:hypothetical protein
LEGVDWEGVEEFVGHDEGHLLGGWDGLVSDGDRGGKGFDLPMGIDLIVSVQTMGRALYLHTLW